MNRPARLAVFVAWAMGAVLLLGRSGGADDTTDTTDWRTGAAWHRRLAAPVQGLWAQKPLREAIEGLSRAQRVAIWLDRRVDPGQGVDLDVGGRPLRDVLAEIAKAHHLGWSLFEPVVYFGPSAAAARLRTVAESRREEVRQLGLAAAGAFHRSAPSRWDDLAEPRALLAELGRTAGIEIRGLERVPHDLWPAADWPAMSLADRLTLLLVPFDLTYRIDPTGRAIELVPLPEEVSITKTYPGGSDPEALARRLAARAPRCRVSVEGERVTVRGLLEDVEQIGRSASAAPGETSKTLGATDADLDHIRIARFAAENRPLGEVLGHVAKQLGLEITLDENTLRQAGVSRERLISVKLDNATVDELLAAILAPVGLRFTRHGRTVEIQPAAGHHADVTLSSVCHWLRQC